MCKHAIYKAKEIEQSHGAYLVREKMTKEESDLTPSFQHSEGKTNFQIKLKELPFPRVTEKEN